MTGARSRPRGVRFWALVGALVAAGALTVGGIAIFQWSQLGGTYPELCSCPAQLIGMPVGGGFAGPTYSIGNVTYVTTEFYILATPEKPYTPASSVDLRVRLVNSTGASLPFAAVGTVNATGCWLGYEVEPGEAWTAGEPPTASPSARSCGGSLGPGTILTTSDEFFLITTSRYAEYVDSLMITDTGTSPGWSEDA